MKQLIQELIDVHHDTNEFYEDEIFVVTIAEPASASDLQRLDDFFRRKGIPTPPSLREFLSLYNGIEDLVTLDFSILSVEQIVSGHLFLAEEELEDFPNNLDIVIGGGGAGYILGIDREALQDDGEAGVISISPNFDVSRAGSLREFLEQTRDSARLRLEAERKDREGLPDN